MRISHIAWNFTGLSLPLIVAALTVPALVDQLGQERFGILALAWGLVGYAGALDLGIGRALTQKVGSLIGKNDFGSISTALATASRITFFSGLVGFVLIVIAGFLVVPTWIKSNSFEHSEFRNCLFLLAVALPAQAMSSTYKGINEAFLNFKYISLLRALLGALNFGGPYLISLYTNKLSWLIGSIVLSRLMALLIFQKLAFNCLPNDYKKDYFYSKYVAKSLFSFGGWITVSSIASPVLVQADRFFIASIISAVAVYTYVVPYEIVVQSLILVGAVSSVIFPNLSRLIQSGPSEWKSYFDKWVGYVAIMMGIVCVSMAILLPFILPLWLKNNFDKDSVALGQILCLGVFANSIASMYYALIHAKGHAEITAKIHLVELPLFLITLSFFISHFGVKGAAWAWSIRMIFDCLALIQASKKFRSKS